MRVPGLGISVDTEQVPWRTTGSEGVRWLLLASEARPAEADEATSGAELGATVLIRMEPGFGYPPHLHRDVEEVLVLAGGYRDAEGEYCAGDYVRYAAGSAHAPVALGDARRPAGPDNPACVLFATARGGITPLAAGPSV